MRRVVVYAGTRNIYPAMVTAAKSLLINNEIDRVYFMIEDDEFPEPLPDVIRCINVSGQTYFPPDGANYNTRWSYMTMMRLAMPDLFPDEDLVLWLDVDTIVVGDISDLFELDMSGCYFACAEEPMRSKRPFIYYNAGVMLADLKALRDGKYKQLIHFCNVEPLDFPDQDCINLNCQRRIMTINPIYNSCAWTCMPQYPKIVHFAADREYTKQALFIEYSKKEWRI